MTEQVVIKAKIANSLVNKLHENFLYSATMGDKRVLVKTPEELSVGRMIASERLSGTLEKIEGMPVFAFV